MINATVLKYKIILSKLQIYLSSFLPFWCSNAILYIYFLFHRRCKYMLYHKNYNCFYIIQFGDLVLLSTYRETKNTNDIFVDQVNRLPGKVNRFHFFKITEPTLPNVRKTVSLKTRFVLALTYDFIGKRLVAPASCIINKICPRYVWSVTEESTVVTDDCPKQDKSILWQGQSGF